jgi:hypothetical protein
MNWKEKSLAATRGTKFGAVVACALNHETPAPCFSGKASVTSDKFVMCNYTDANGEGHMGAFVGSLDDIERNAVGLANHLKLSGDERSEYSAALASWIALDYSGGAADRAFRRNVHPGPGCIMVHWSGMWLGIEPDGYTHS